MKALLRLVLALVTATALAAGLAAAPAQAKSSTVSTRYTAPKYGQTNSGVKALQYRLVKAKTLSSRYTTGYYGSLTKAAVKKFQKKNGLKATGKVSRTTWKKLVKKTGKITLKSTKAKSKKSKLAKRCQTGRVLCISKNDRKVRWVVNGKVKMTLDARFGCRATATRNGTFKVYWKSYNHTSTLYNTWMPRAMFFSGGQAVHYSSDFRARGYNGCSHGCVNTRDFKKISSLYSQVRVGDKVVVYN